MIENINEYIQVLDWKEARAFVKKGDKGLFDIIDAISPGNKFKFYKMRYPYGTTIMGDDTVYFPDKPFTSTPLAFAEVPDKIKQDLNYQSVPLGLITENTLEIFKEYPDKVFCVCLSGPNEGIQVGIFEYFGLTTCYTVTAGARSVYMVPKISETRYHKRIMNAYNINCYQPKSIFKHWQIFKSLYASGNLKTKWETEIIYLNKNFHEMANDKSLEWQNFKSYLYKKGFEHSGFGRKQVILNLVWEKMTSVLKEEGMKPDPYTIDTLKHLIYVFVEALAGSRPITNDYAGPLTEIQKIYLDVYGLTNIPTIMAPYHFNYEQNIPVYYSMQCPTLLSSTPNLRKLDTIIQEMNSLNGIKDFLISKSADIGKMKLNNQYLVDMLRKMKFSYFHGDMYSYGVYIRPTKEIIDTDQDFLFSPIKNGNLSFAENGAFIKGCVKISKAT